MATVMRKVSELRPGDLVDLQDDKHADPCGDKIELQCEYQRVESVERETAACLVVTFESFSTVGFPPDHLVPVESCRTVQLACPREFNQTEKDLAASLACYCSDEEWGYDRRVFLNNVRDRIDMDLATGDY